VPNYSTASPQTTAQQRCHLEEHPISAVILSEASIPTSDVILSEAERSEAKSKDLLLPR
jgi:hypothetical protein